VLYAVPTIKAGSLTMPDPGTLGQADDDTGARGKFRTGNSPLSAVEGTLLVGLLRSMRPQRPDAAIPQGGRDAHQGAGDAAE
jgi:hypothetical protein